MEPEKEKIIQNTEQKKKNGGARPGAGRKPGVLGIRARTLLEVKQRIAEKADDLLNAELLESLGSFVVMKADPETLEYSRVTDEQEIVKFIQEYKGANGKIGNSVYILAAKDGNYKSRQYLFDRAFGRPSQSVDVTSTIDMQAELTKYFAQQGVDEPLVRQVLDEMPVQIIEGKAS